MFYIDVFVFPIYWMHNFICRNWTKIKKYFYLVPRGCEKIWPCKLGRDEKSLKSTGLNHKYYDKLAFLFMTNLFTFKSQLAAKKLGLLKIFLKVNEEYILVPMLYIHTSPYILQFFDFKFEFISIHQHDILLFIFRKRNPRKEAT